MEYMFNRVFEKFLLEQVRRESALYYGLMVTFACCTIACAVMAAAALILFRTEAVGIIIKLLLVMLIMAGACGGCRTVAQNSREAAAEMADVLADPECDEPADYTEKTEAARQSACRNLHSIRGLIISYSIIGLLLWAVTLLIAFLVLSDSLSSGLLFVAFVTFAMGLGLIILSVAYLCDLPAAKRYRKMIDSSMDED